MICSLSIAQLTFSSPNNGYKWISTSCYGLRKDSEEWALILHHLESFFNATKLEQFVLNLFSPLIPIDSYLSDRTNQSLTLRTLSHNTINADMCKHYTHTHTHAQAHTIHTVTHNSTEVKNTISLYPQLSLCWKVNAIRPENKTNSINICKKLGQNIIFMW